MRDVVRKLLQLTNRRERVLAIALMLFMILNAFMQMVGVASIMPFLAVLSDPEMVHNNQYLRWLYEQLGFQETSSFLFFLGGLAFGFIVLGNASMAATTWGEIRFTFMLQYSVSRRLMTDFLRRPYIFFVSRNSGDLAKTVLEESRQAVEGAVLPALKMVSHVLMAAALIALLLWIDPWLATASAAAFAVVYGAIYLLARMWLQRSGAARVQANKQRFVAVGEAFSGAKEIRLLGRETVYLDRYRKAAREYARHQANASVLGQMPLFAVEALAFGGVIVIVMYLLAEGGLATALPVIGVYALAAKRLVPAFQAIFNGITRLRFTIPAVDNLLSDLGDRPGSTSLPDPRNQPEPLIPRDTIELSNIAFQYPGARDRALKNLSMTIQANKTIGLVGSSGAGKSTLVDILLGLLQPDDGTMRVDGIEIDSGNMRRWQSGIGYVPQHIFLADDDVMGNIALGVPREEIDPEAVKRAARLANLHDFVTQELPHGYETPVGEKGLRLSGGQRQRIGIARALYQDPAILVFDEATSALDNATERVVMSAVHNLSNRKTILLIAHRLSTVKPCDRIFVLNAGQVVESGSWDELQQTGPEFQKLAAGV